MKNLLLISLLFVACESKSNKEIYQDKYDSTIKMLDTQIRLAKFYLQRGRETGDTSYFITADSFAIEAQKSLIKADSFNREKDVKKIYSPMGDSVYVSDSTYSR